GLKDYRRPRGERRTSDIFITCEHLVSHKRLRALYERGPNASRLLGSLVYEAPGVGLNNCRPGHGLMDRNVPPSLIDV
ncbi:hypothetical protein HOY80DRAFT_895434, partial [Tuber brumale]